MVQSEEYIALFLLLTKERSNEEDVINLPMTIIRVETFVFLLI